MKKVTIFVLLIISNCLNAQWVRTNLHSGKISLVIGSGNSLFAGTRNSGYYVSTDNGESWKRTGLNSERPVLSCVIDGTKHFAATYGAGVYLSTNQGAIWSNVSNNLGNLNVLSIKLIDSKLYAGTENGLYRSTNNGNSWNEIGFNNKIVTDITFHNSQIFVSTTTYGVFNSTNGGVTWNAINAGLNSLLIQTIISSGTKLLLGTKDKGVYVSENNGLTWKESNVGLSFRSVRILYNHGSLIFAGTTNGLFYSNTSGQSWIKLDTSLWNLCDISSIYEYGNNLYVGTNGDGIYKSTNNGIEWEAKNNGLPGIYCPTLTSSDAEIFVGTSDAILKTSDLGNRWHLISPDLEITPYVSSIVVDKENVFIGTRKNLYISSDNGTTWNIQNKQVYSIAMNNNNLYVGTMWDGVFFSNDKGKKWTQIKSGIGNFVSSIDFYDNKILSSASNGLFVLNENESIWYKITNGLPAVYVAKVFVNGNNIYACTGHGLYRSIDGGETFESINNGLTSSDIRAIATIETNLFVGTYHGGIFYSSDNGKVWNEKNENLSSKSVESLLITKSHLIAGTGSGVWKRPLYDFFEIKSNDSTTFFQLFQNNPNPFYSKTTISYSIPNAEHITLKVFDVLGREVATVVNEYKQPGAYKADFNASGLVSGVYFYRLRAGSYVQTKKLMVLK